MAQVTELKVYGTMGGLYGRDFSGKVEDIPSGGVAVSPRVEDERLVRVTLLEILIGLMVVLWV
jgi:hypothetical protein